jgi:hypothetical protein
MRSLRLRSGHAKGGIIGGLLKLIGQVVVGLFCLGVVGSMIRQRPTPTHEPIPVAVAPGPAAQPGPVTPIAPAPVPFDRDEANRAVAGHSFVPLTPEEKTHEERQRLIDRRKAKRAAQAKRAAGQAPAAKGAMAAEPTPPAYSGATSGATGGSVHVRGYHRKDGTYVRSHTRSAPRR